MLDNNNELISTEVTEILEPMLISDSYSVDSQIRRPWVRSARVSSVSASSHTTDLMSHLPDNEPVMTLLYRLGD